ncbi:glycosyl transferase family 90 [Enterovibrio norvegicus]|uniref:Lipopolysaccharide A protein n=1 Tax=Enterovibrio norvegicus TaxID=188144 RepID=A0A2N7LEB2_9GAMM|nr:glycosyl transferase family 90 [Enterovibrio norvegicus]PMN93739.1 lipopolysaccharide A protein [Enterovibrio norvegicus]
MKFFYYLNNLLLNIFPSFIFMRYKKKLEDEFHDDLEELQHRVDYYCKLDRPMALSDKAESREVGYKLRDKSAYYFDLKQYLYYFPRHFKFCYYFGDKVAIESYPTIYKARPTQGDNKNSVLFKLDKYRHFRFMSDNLKFADKKSMAVFRGRVTQKHRIRFMEKMFGHELVDAGQSNISEDHPEWKQPFMSVDDQLKYKFIICLEGNDVASNLKWAMSSNSIVVSPKMRFETWFMEGALVPGVHFIEVKDDWSDFEEKISFYLENPNKADDILENAHLHVSQFKDSRREDYISIKTLEKYFNLCKQE